MSGMKSDEDGIEIRLKAYFAPCESCERIRREKTGDILMLCLLRDGVGHIILPAGQYPLCEEPP